MTDVQVHCSACSNLCDDYCEPFDLVFLLLLISHEYSFVGLFLTALHMYSMFSSFVKVGGRWQHRSLLAHGHYKNVYATAMTTMPKMIQLALK